MIARGEDGGSLSALRRGGEFDRIRAFLGYSTEAGRPGDEFELTVGPGDDAAVLGELVLSTDMSVEDVHFRRGWIDLPAVGFRSVTVALSDLGAMGAQPLVVLCSLALPDSGTDAIRALGDGVREAAAAAGAVVAGGDLSRSPGPLVIDVVAVGRSADPVLRSTAHDGDDLWVSGVLGGAAGAVATWKDGGTPEGSLLRRFERPDPPLGLLRELRASGRVTAGIDVSDGLLADAEQLAAASGLCVRVEEARVPVDPGLSGLPRDRRLELALTGGEDYQVLFTAPVEARGALESPRDDGVLLTRIGTVVSGSGVVRVMEDGGETEVTRAGFDHFAGDAT